jgi:hypothetical protein
MAAVGDMVCGVVTEQERRLQVANETDPTENSPQIITIARDDDPGMVAEEFIEKLRVLGIVGKIHHGEDESTVTLEVRPGPEPETEEISNR